MIDYKNLFGSPDWCQCSDCQSVSSPAAYLVDILNFLDDAARNILFDPQRRPDLGEIQLSCDNTNIPLPYIDLVNEVLERAVLTPATANTVTPPPGGWPQTSSTAAELAANPQHVLDGAYRELLKTVYPWNLPFDFGIEEARIYLGHLGVRRSQLMQAFADQKQVKFDQQTYLTPTAPTAAEIAAEDLRLTPLDRLIITAGLTGKAAVAAASSGQLTLNGLPSGNISGIAVKAGDRVLVKNQANPAENGIYVVAQDAWPRAVDAQQGGIDRGLLVRVRASTQSGFWVQTSAGPITVGTTALTFSKLAVAGSFTNVPQAAGEFWYPQAEIQQNWLALISHVRTFLDRSSLAYQDLLDLLATDYINIDPQNTYLVVFSSDECNLDSAKISPTLDEAAASRIHRFVRLQRKLGWMSRDLDAAIRTLVPGDLTDRFLLKLSHIVRFQQDLRVPLRTVLGWWGPIDVHEGDNHEPSIYEQLFQNKAVRKIEGTGDTFALAQPPVELANTNNKLSEHIPALIAGLGISAADLSLIINSEAASTLALPSAEITDDKLNLANLSHLYRITSFARTLGLSIPDFLSLKAMSGIDPFDGDRVEETRRFVDVARSIGAAKFTIPELNYLLRHVFQSGAGVAPDEDAVKVLLAEMRVGLQKVQVDTAAISDPDGEQTLSRLNLLYPPDKFPGRVSAAIAIVDGTSTLTDPQKTQFITANLPFLDSKQLVGVVAIKEVSDRFKYVLQSYLRTSLSESLVKQKLALPLKLEIGLLETLLKQAIKAPTKNRMALDEFLDPDFISGKNPLDDAIKTFTKLHKVSLLVKKFRINADLLGTPDSPTWLVDVGPSRGWLDFNGLPFASSQAAAGLFRAWLRVRDLFAVSARLRPGKPHLYSIFNQANLVDYQHALSDRTGWPREELEALIGSGNMLGLVFPDDFADERAVVRLQACFDLLGRLGIHADQVRSWIKADLSNADFSKAHDIRQAIKAKYDETEWLDVAKPLRDVLRDAQRAALVAYLTGQRYKKFPDANALFDWYLIDAEMSSCALTSRIKQAGGSVQLFIQRALLKLDNSPTLNATQADRWLTWMKSYRIWEANRLVFLYPENFIQFELRRDKTPFFGELESRLLQSELTQETAETAFLTYLEQLNQVARLEVVALLHQKEPATEKTKAIDILHVFARTFSTPHVYYYRQFVDNLHWKPWTEMKVDITADQLVPVIWNRKLHVFWPVFTVKSEDAQNANTIPKRFMELQLAWSDYEHNRWTAKKISNPETESFKVQSFAAYTPLDKTQYLARAVFVDNQDYGGQDLVIQVLWAAAGSVRSGDKVIKGEGVSDARFRFNDCGGRINVDVGPFIPGKFNVPDFGELVSNAISELPPGSEGGSLNLVQEDETGIEVLTRAPGLLRVVFPHVPRMPADLVPYRSTEACFFADERRTFFVVPGRYAPSAFQRQAIERWQTQNASGGLANDVEFSYPMNAIQADTSPEYHATSVAADGMAASSRSAGNDGSVGGFAADWSAPGWLQPGFLDDRPSTGGMLMPDDPRQFEKIDHPSQKLETRYEFRVFYHPYACELLRRVKRYGIDGLLTWPLDPDPANAKQPQPLDVVFFDATYKPYDGHVLKNDDNDYPKEHLDFADEMTTAYSQYNWELFFHVPLYIAARLSKNQRFREAQRWFHYVFDPTDRSQYPEPARYWKVRRLFELDQNGPPQTIAQLLNDVQNLNTQVAAWRETPFDPHLLARMRLGAYQKTVVMKYLDNLIAWGDQLFRRDTIESINEATQLYILAAEILGPRPEVIPPPAIPTGPKTFNQLKSGSIDDFSNELVDIENFVPVNQLPQHVVGDGFQVVSGVVSKTNVFCIPANEQLLGYWDSVADRLFKIRHCMNIEGVVRQLPLFEPPINPMLLVRAAAAGVDLQSALNDATAAVPPYRYTTMIQRALELCNDVKQLGASLLAALEKRDSENLALLRSQNEVDLLTAVRAIKEKQIDEANQQIEILNQAQVIAGIRLNYFSTLEKVSKGEKSYLDYVNTSKILQGVNAGMEFVAGILYFIPTFKIGFVTTTGANLGGSNFASAIQSFGGGLSATSAALGSEGAQASASAGYDRRWEDWQHQVNVIMGEEEQIKRQIAAAQVRLAIARLDLRNHDKQLDQAQVVNDFMYAKFTNSELYDWMVGQISDVYLQTYLMALDLAKRAQRAWQFERGDFDSSFIQFGGWDSLKKGLMAGERLYFDLKRMELAYLDQNKREYEITKHVTLAQIDPRALLTLKETGECFVSLPESLFDGDFPGHYMRRIKSVSLTIPAVAGPYTSINCKLTLLWNSLRLNATGQSYQRTGANDKRFHDNVGAIQSVVTSNGQNDSGLFELNIHDERYLFFEGAGAISNWRIELPLDTNLFDFETISDLILHVRYTARDGGDAFANLARTFYALPSTTHAAPPPAQPLTRLFSARQEFPGELYRFLHQPDNATPQILKLDFIDRFPVVPPKKQISISAVEVFFRLPADTPYDENTPLKITVKPSGGGESNPPTPLKVASNLTHLLLHALVPGGGAIGSDWEIRLSQIPSSIGLGGGTTRIDPALIEDVVVLCPFTVS